MVDAGGKLIGVVMTFRGRHDVVLRIIQIWNREQCKQARSLRAPQILRNLISSKWGKVIERILQSNIERAEVAGSERYRRHHCQARNTIAAILIFPGDKKESLVTPDRTP